MKAEKFLNPKTGKTMPGFTLEELSLRFKISRDTIRNLSSAERLNLINVYEEIADSRLNYEDANYRELPHEGCNKCRYALNLKITYECLLLTKCGVGRCYICDFWKPRMEKGNSNTAGNGATQPKEV